MTVIHHSAIVVISNPLLCMAPLAENKQNTNVFNVYRNKCQLFNLNITEMFLYLSSNLPNSSLHVSEIKLHSTEISFLGLPTQEIYSIIKSSWNPTLPGPLLNQNAYIEHLSSLILTINGLPSGMVV